MLFHSRNQTEKFYSQCFQQNVYFKPESNDVIHEYKVVKQLKKTKIPIPQYEYMENPKGLCSLEVDAYTLNRVLDNSELDTALYDAGVKLACIHEIRTDITNRVSSWNWERIEGKPNFFLKEVREWLKANIPIVNNNSTVFVHGDYHPSNILINGGKVKAIIDWEFSGIGCREKDIAWAISVRENLSLFVDERQVQLFLKGYRSQSELNNDFLKWYRVRALVFLYDVSKKINENYCEILYLKILEILK